MALARAEDIEAKPEKQPVVKIIEKVSAPIVVAYKQFYKEQPQAALELFLFGLFLLLTFIGEMVKGLPVAWYAILAFWVASRFSLLEKLNAYIKKKKK